ncbi:unnamed protein product [Closterium sp. Naga37s-1]|nr:unnamed protein product [Closterium sp. Naga37s-1]
MVTDDLEFFPSSTIKSIKALSSMGVKTMADLESYEINVTKDQALALVQAALASSTALNDVFGSVIGSVSGAGGDVPTEAADTVLHLFALPSLSPISPAGLLPSRCHSSLPITRHRSPLPIPHSPCPAAPSHASPGLYESHSPPLPGPSHTTTPTPFTSSAASPDESQQSPFSCSAPRACPHIACSLRCSHSTPHSHGPSHCATTSDEIPIFNTSPPAPIPHSFPQIPVPPSPPARMLIPLCATPPRPTLLIRVALASSPPARLHPPLVRTSLLYPLPRVFSFRAPFSQSLQGARRILKATAEADRQGVCPRLYR